MDDTTCTPATGTNFCSNCKRDIAKVNFVIHEVHCKRNIILCKKCLEPVARTELEAHINELHTPIECQLCHQFIEPQHVDIHRTTLCTQRQCVCEFCSLEFTASCFSEHVAYCGSRTELCTQCHQYILYRDLTQHNESNCVSHLLALPTSQQPQSQPICDWPFAVDYNMKNFDDLLCFHDNPAPLVADRQLPSVADGCHLESQLTNRKPAGIAKRKQAAVSGHGNASVVASRNSGAAGGRGHKFLVTNRNRATTDGSSVKNRSGIATGDESVAMSSVAGGGRTPAAHHRDTVTTAADEADLCLLPCEFCSGSFPAEILCQHQAFCSAGVRRSDIYGHSKTSSDVYGDNLLSRAMCEGDHVRQVDVMDEFLSDEVEQWLQDEQRICNNVDDQVLLPCEFCDDLFPATQLPFHQVNCQVHLDSIAHPTATLSSQRHNSVPCAAVASRTIKPHESSETGSGSRVCPIRPVSTATRGLSPICSKSAGVTSTNSAVRSRPLSGSSHRSSPIHSGRIDTMSSNSPANNRHGVNSPADSRHAATHGSAICSRPAGLTSTGTTVHSRPAGKLNIPVSHSRPTNTAVGKSRQPPGVTVLAPPVEPATLQRPALYSRTSVKKRLNNSNISQAPSPVTLQSLPASRDTSSTSLNVSPHTVSDNDMMTTLQGSGMPRYHNTGGGGGQPQTANRSQMTYSRHLVNNHTAARNNHSSAANNHVAASRGRNFRTQQQDELMK